MLSSVAAFLLSAVPTTQTSEALRADTIVDVDASLSRVATGGDVPAESENGAPAADPSVQRSFDEFRVVRRNGERATGYNGSLTANRLTGVLADGGPLDVSRDDIRTLYVKDGSHAASMAAYGGAIGLVVSFAAVLQVASDPSLDTDATSSLAVVGGSTALGALIGLAVGAATPRWRVEPIAAPGQRYSLRMKVSL